MLGVLNSNFNLKILKVNKCYEDYEDLIMEMYKLTKNSFYTAKNITYSGFKANVLDSLTFLVTKNSEVVSFLTAYMELNFSIIDIIAVKKKYRNKGIGSFIVEFAKKFLNYPVFLVTIKEFEEFYKKFGFKNYSDKFSIYVPKLVDVIKLRFEREGLKRDFNFSHGKFKSIFENEDGILLVCSGVDA